MTTGSSFHHSRIARTLFVFLASVTVITAHGSEAAPPLGQKYEFKLTRGKGTPVCDAYLQRLRATFFVRPPYCGRPENDAVPGFALLHRVPLSLSETVALYPRIESRAMYGDQYARERMDAENRSRGIETKPSSYSLDSILDSDMRGGPDRGRLAVWRYEPPIDVENNGATDNLIVWYGSGASHYSGPCGTYTSNLPAPGRVSQVALFLTPDSTAVDETKTMSVFGHPRSESVKETLPRLDLRMIGPQIGIFEYQGVYYFDTVFDLRGDFENRRVGDVKLMNTLGVFVRKNDATHQVCEYTFDDKN